MRFGPRRGLDLLFLPSLAVPQFFVPFSAISAPNGPKPRLLASCVRARRSADRGSRRGVGGGRSGGAITQQMRHATRQLLEPRCLALAVVQPFAARALSLRHVAASSSILFCSAGPLAVYPRPRSSARTHCDLTLTAPASVRKDATDREISPTRRNQTTLSPLKLITMASNFQSRVYGYVSQYAQSVAPRHSVSREIETLFFSEQKPFPATPWRAKELFRWGECNDYGPS